MQVLPSDSGFDHPTLERLLVSLVHRARKNIVITTPYFIPEDGFLAALGTAVLRDVEVTLILPSRNDSVLVGYAQRSYYEELLALGVRVMLYKPSFLHAKLFVIDDEVGAIGSSNMDVRSFALNAEVTLLLYDRDDVAKLKREQQRYLSRCEQLRPEHLEQFGRWSRLVENVTRLVSPLL
jgi:cardiolipin synthase